MKSEKADSFAQDTVAVRREQLRRAKKNQRDRERQCGLVTYELRLPSRLAQKLKAGSKRTDFTAALHAFVDHQVIGIENYDNLRLIAWNRSGGFVTRAEAFQLYENNWRHIDQDGMSPGERALIKQLAEEHGKGLINA